MHPIIWLAALILFGVGEALTAGLTSIWFAAGALGALIVSQLGFGFWPQIVTFLVLTALTLLLVRPAAKKLMRSHYSATNADRVIGAIGLVTEDIDNLAGKGLVTISGQVWSARSVQTDGGVISAGQEVRIQSIQGVKVMVEPLPSDRTQNRTNASTAKT